MQCVYMYLYHTEYIYCIQAPFANTHDAHCEGLNGKYNLHAFVSRHPQSIIYPLSLMYFKGGLNCVMYQEMYQEICKLWLQSGDILAVRV